MSDARLSTALPSHPKTKKLIRRLGPGAGWSLVCLLLWTAANRSDGDLSRMTSEDIELAAEWGGELDLFVATLADVGFLDGKEGAYQIHDWAEHNPWVNGADMRSAKARWNAVKRHHGMREADRQVPEWAAIRNADSNASSTESDASSNARSTGAAMLEPERSNAPSPSPSPSPSEELESPDGDSGDLLGDQAESTVTDHPASTLLTVVLAAYHELLPSCRRIAVLNPKRRKRIQAADKLARQVCKQQGWAYVPKDFWEAYFDQCLQDPWLRGDVPSPKNPGWKQNLDVLLAEDRFAEIMDRAIATMADAA